MVQAARRLRASGWCAAIAVTVAAIALAGWVLDHPGLESLIAGAAPMNPATAAAILLGGLSLLCAARETPGRDRAALLLAIPMLLVPTLRFLQLLFHWSFSIDRLLFASRIAATPDDGPARMSAGVAILLLILGLSILLAPRRSDPARLTARTGALFLAGIFGLAGLTYLSRLASPASTASAAPPVLNTIVAALFLSIAAARTVTEREPPATGSGAILGLSRRVAIATWVAGSILAATTGLALWSGGRSKEAAGRRLDAQRLRREIVALRSSIQDAETGQRGYLLTGDTAYLAPYRAALDSLPLQRERLSALVRAGQRAWPEAAGYLDLIDQKLAELRRTVALREAGKGDSSVLEVRRGRGEETMSRIRLASAALVQVPDSDIARWDARVVREQSITGAATVVAGILAILFLSLAGIAIRRDLRRRGEAEAALAESERRQSQIIDLMPSVVVLKDPTDLRIMRINKAGEVLQGVPASDLVGRRNEDFYAPEAARLATESDRQTLNTSGVMDLPEQWLETRNNGRRAIHTRKLAVRDEAGRPLYVLTVSEDVTDRKLAEIAIREAKEAAEAANHAKSAFLAKMSHELRTPLNSIIGFSEILEDGGAGELNDKQKRYIGNVLLSGRNLLQLINDILDLSKVEAGRVELMPANFDITPLFEQACTVVETMAARKHIELHRQVSPGLPQLSADRAKVLQILVNLLGNAVKYTPSGGKVELGARLVADESASGGWIEIWVADNGIGIAPGDQQRIFNEFEQVPSGTGAEQEGTGLGLALVRKLVELHGGRISLESEVGRGSTFRVRLPVDAEPAAAAPADAVDGAGTGPLVLVIDDEPHARDLISHYLTNAGYRVARAARGERALELARRLKPDAITLDILMPERDGFEILTELKNHEETRTIPVVVVSISDQRELGFTLGAAEWLVKPVHRSVLLAAIERTLGAVNGTSRRVLVVDDDQGTREQLQSLLQARGLMVRAAESGSAGIELARHEPPDLVVLDLVMPGMDGFQVVEALRAEPATRKIPILILTAKDLTAAERAQLRRSVQAIVSKGGKTEFLTELNRLVPVAEVAS